MAPNEANVALGSAPDPESALQPLQLFTPMTIQPNFTLSVFSTSPIEIREQGEDAVTIHSPIPFVISTHCITYVCLGEPLGSEFVRGWNKLPDELKLRILAFNLVSHEPLTCDVVHKDRIPNDTFKSYLSHLHMTPEIASLSREVFWTLNIFRLESSNWEGAVLLAAPYGPRPYFEYPKAPMANYVRHLEFGLEIFDDDWNRLRELAKGSYGFSNVRKVKVIVTLKLYIRMTSDIWLQEKSVSRALVIRFVVQDTVEFKVEFTEEPGLDKTDFEDRQALEDYLREKSCSKTEHSTQGTGLAGGMTLIFLILVGNFDFSCCLKVPFDGL